MRRTNGRTDPFCFGYYYYLFHNCTYRHVVVIIKPICDHPLCPFDRIYLSVSVSCSKVTIPVE